MSFPGNKQAWAQKWKVGTTVVVSCACTSNLSMASSLLPGVAAGSFSAPNFNGSCSNKQLKVGAVLQPALKNDKHKALVQVQEDGGGLLSSISKRVVQARTRLINSFIDAFYKPLDEPNVYYQGNFAPIDEIGKWVPAKVIEGALPHDFPAGTYIRNGSNPYLGGKSMQTPFGRALFHWFEGDGMLHATRFGKGEASIHYQNKYVETNGYKLEKDSKKPAFLASINGDSMAVSMNILLNKLRFGKANKATCNTQVFEHAGRIYAVAEADLPYEIDISDLRTIGSSDYNGEWDRPFTAHPKVDPETNEMVVFGCTPVKPYLVVGVLSANGTLVHKVDVGLTRSIFTHELPITERYNIILDFPLTIDVQRLMRGGPLMVFEKETCARIGIMPRYGDAKSVKWFEVEMGFAFHCVNAFEEGDEVVLHTTYTRVPFALSTSAEDFVRGITPSETARDPWIDGALFSRLHEWKFDLEKGTVKERDLTGLDTSAIEMPTINKRYTGRKNKYAYAQVLDLDSSRAAGMPKYGKFVKIHMPDGSSQSHVAVKYHDLGPNRFGSEPLFVARPNANAEDDGWIMSYVHDESTEKSEVYILDAQNFENKAVTRISLPQRVPYGFHSSYILSELATFPLLQKRLAEHLERASSVYQRINSEI